MATSCNLIESNVEDPLQVVARFDQVDAEIGRITAHSAYDRVSTCAKWPPKANNSDLHQRQHPAACEGSARGRHRSQLVTARPELGHELGAKGA